MDEAKLRSLLEAVRAGGRSVDEAVAVLRSLPYEDLGFAKVDHHRALRTGYPEVILSQGKTTEQVVAIAASLARQNRAVLATRASREVFEAVKAAIPTARYFDAARIILVESPEEDRPEPVGLIAVVTGGTADLPVAEEAAVTAEAYGNKVARIYDVGVAGLHRLLDRREAILAARVVVVVAGMEGALASVVGGLVSAPVVAVPTSVGYGANFGGLSALLAMLNSCAAGIGVVNIDNGFGAGYLASIINHLGEARPQ